MAHSTLYFDFSPDPYFTPHRLTIESPLTLYFTTSHIRREDRPTGLLRIQTVVASLGESGELPWRLHTHNTRSKYQYGLTRMSTKEAYESLTDYALRNKNIKGESGSLYCLSVDIKAHRASAVSPPPPSHHNSRHYSKTGQATTYLSMVIGV